MNQTKNTAARWQAHAQASGTRRTRRIAMRMRPETAGRLLFLAKLAGESSTHTVERLIDAEFEKRQHDPKAPEIWAALETLGAV